MRRLVTALLLWSLLATVAATGAAAAPVEDPAPADLPAGFTDGVPVAGTGDPSAAAPAGEQPDTTSAASTGSKAASSTRYFGEGPWNAIVDVAATTARCSNLSPGDLTALVVAPIFKESSAATTASSAPSPMTLSRYDEWNGTYATTSNNSANYGLYAFRDPYTPYVQAYWHPGIGIWQYDSAGVGAPYTAVERMDVRVVAGDVAKGMASRYCNPPTAVVGHAAPFTEQERRNAAWWPWWAGSTTRSCPLCQAEFDRMTASTPYFANVSKVAGITTTGGAVKRTCSLPGVAGNVECWYVDPRVGVIQGAAGWTANPDGKGSPTIAPAPLSKPFYVIKRNGYEERHWLKVDSGYSIDISGKHLLGTNERPRSNQAGSGVTWASSSGLCDLTTSRGSCTATPPVRTPDPVKPPAGISATTYAVNATYRPVTLDVNGDGKGDVFWYAPGAAADALWLGKGSGQFQTVAVPNVGGTFSHVEVLDANGDGRDDLLFYDRGAASAHLWRGNANGTFTTSSHTSAAGRQPLVGDFDGNGRDEVFWYGPGAISDAQWTWNGGGFTSKAFSVNATYQPFVGDFDGTGTDDLFWYAPGAAADSVWLHRANGTFLSKSYTINTTYRPTVGDFDGDGKDDIFWYAPGTTPDPVWFMAGSGAFASQTATLGDTYTPLVVDLMGDGREDIIWNGSGTQAGLWTTWSGGRVRATTTLEEASGHQALRGAFSTGGGDGVLWYAPGGTPDATWWR